MYLMACIALSLEFSLKCVLQKIVSHIILINVFFWRRDLLIFQLTPGYGFRNFEQLTITSLTFSLAFLHCSLFSLFPDWPGSFLFVTSPRL